MKYLLQHTLSVTVASLGILFGFAKTAFAKVYHCTTDGQFTTRLSFVFILGISLLLVVGCTSYRTAGLIVNADSNDVIVFDPPSSTILGSVALPTDSNPVIRPATISRNGAVGFVAVDSLIYLIDMKADPPTLLEGTTNPITLTIQPIIDLVAVPNGLFLLAAGNDFISVFTTLNPWEIRTFDPGNGVILSIDACDNGATVLVGMSGFPGGVVKKLFVDENGTLSDSGESVSTPKTIQNAYCTPGSEVGIMVTGGWDADVQSFTLPNMSAVDRLDLTAASMLEDPDDLAMPFGLSGQFSIDGARFYARSTGGSPPRGYVDRFVIDPVTGAMSALEPIPLNERETMYWTVGGEYLALVEKVGEILVPAPAANKLLIFSASTGQRRVELTSEYFDRPTTIVVVEPPE